MRRIFLDTETTGFGADKHRIVSVGAVAYNDRDAIGGESGEFDCYVNPSRAIDAQARHIHGLSEAFLSGFPTFDGRAQDIADFIRGAEVVIHNAEFDESFLNAEFGRLKMPPLADVAAKVVCSLMLARKLHPQLPGHSLDALCGHFRVDNSARVKHGALTDARLLAQVYLRMTLEQMTFALPGAKAAAAAEDGGGKVPIIRATKAERAAHESHLDTMREKTKGVIPLWRRK
ncbi:MAG: exonuclease domain-containing protein [Gammaproteobacteria bacterium]